MPTASAAVAGCRVAVAAPIAYRRAGSTGNMARRPTVFPSASEGTAVAATAEAGSSLALGTTETAGAVSRRIIGRAPLKLMTLYAQQALAATGICAGTGTAAGSVGQQGAAAAGSSPKVGTLPSEWKVSQAMPVGSVTQYLLERA